jgi:hypothetical protein
MRVAVCFKGFTRHWKTTHPNWQRLFDRYQTDVFVHTWDTEEYKDHRDIINLESGNVDGREFDIGSFVDAYKPKAIITESYKNFHNKFVEGCVWLEEGRKEYMKKHPERTWMWYGRYVPMMSIFYKWSQVSKLKQRYEIDNNFVYDIVLHSRTDFQPTDSFTLERSEHIITPPWPNTYHTQHWVDYHKGMNDLWVYGPSKKMDVMSNVYERLHTVWDFCMNTDGYGFFEANNIHSLPITNIMLQGVEGFVKINNQFGQLIR